MCELDGGKGVKSSSTALRYSTFFFQSSRFTVPYLHRAINNEICLGDDDTLRVNADGMKMENNLSAAPFHIVTFPYRVDIFHLHFAFSQSNGENCCQYWRRKPEEFGGEANARLPVGWTTIFFLSFLLSVYVSYKLLPSRGTNIDVFERR